MSNIERTEIRPGYSISRVLKGGWHLAGGHGSIDRRQAIEDMHAFVEAGITTFDCADIYTGVEELIGDFLRQYRDAFAAGDLPPVQIHTKYVPDYGSLPKLTKADTTAAIDRSLRRLGVERLDLVQFHWWDYSTPGYVETALHLQELQQEGKIRYLGVTNFDATHIREMLDAGVEIVSCQVQYSVLDRRPEQGLQALARENNMVLLCYGVIAGGFLSDRYLGAPDPEPPLENRSLVKYRLIINEFGGYDHFQELLQILCSTADRYDVGIAEVAARYMLQQPQVAGVIIGARNRRHLGKLQQLSSFELDAGGLESIRKVVAKAPGPQGPVYALERDKTGRHGAIMKYNLNRRE